MNFRSSGFLILLILNAVFFQTDLLAQKTSKPKKPNYTKPDKPTQPSEKSSFASLENAVVAELNEARTNPQKYIGYLEEYRKNLKGNLLSMPGKTGLVMIEGLPAIEDAIRDLKKVEKLRAFEFSNGLSKVARAQLADLQENPKLKHVGKDGSDLEKRLLKVGFPGIHIAENISSIETDAREIMMNMIVDDGYKSRSHRKNVFSTKFKLFGIACGTASDKMMICVAEFADTFKER